MLKIKPIISLSDTVKVAGKAIGLKRAMSFILKELKNCDTYYAIVPSYTYATEKDDIDPAIACHWGPNAFGYIFVEKEK